MFGLLDLYRRATFEALNGRLRVYLGDRLAAEVVFYDSGLYNSIVEALKGSGKLRKA